MVRAGIVPPPRPEPGRGSRWRRGRRRDPSLRRGAAGRCSGPSLAARVTAPVVALVVTLGLAVVSSGCGRQTASPGAGQPGATSPAAGTAATPSGPADSTATPAPPSPVEEVVERAEGVIGNGGVDPAPPAGSGAPDATAAPGAGDPAAPQDGAATTRNLPRLPEFQGDVRSARAWQRYARSLLDSLVDFIPNLLRALVVLLVFWGLYRAAVGLFHGFVRRTNADPSVLGIGTRLTKYVLFAFGLIMAASQLGFNVGSLLAGISIAGLALGLAAQESLSNVISGLIILWDRPFRVGDNVTIAGTFGRVKEIRLRTTRILTVEQLDAIVPNKEILNHEILNHTLNPQLRLGVPLSIAYKEDTRQARRVLLAAVEGNRLILDQPGATVVVVELADSGVNVELRVWLRDPHAEREALWELTELAKIALDEAGIEIPFPQRTVHFANPLHFADPEHFADEGLAQGALTPSGAVARLRAPQAPSEPSPAGHETTTVESDGSKNDG